MEKIGKIFINGVIGKYRDGSGKLIQGVELVDVIAQVAMQPEATVFNVYISSEGGLVDEGFEIFDYLDSLNVPVNTIGEGMVASIATVIFMVGKRRTLKPNTDFMIHLPSGGVEGDSQDIKDYADYIAGEEKKIIKFYAKHTGLKESALFPLMKKETWLDDKKAFELGFTTSETTELKAVAHFKSKSKSKNKMKKTKNKGKKKPQLNKKDKSALAKFFKPLLDLIGDEAKNLTVTDANGNEVNFPEVETMEDVSVGDTATVDGAPAEGEIVFPDGNTYVFAGGELMEIVEGEEEEEGSVEDQLAAAKKTIKKLEGEKRVAEAKQKKTRKEFKTLKNNLESKFNFAGVKTKKTKKTKAKKAKNQKKKKTGSNAMMKNLSKLKDKRNSR